MVKIEAADTSNFIVEPLAKSNKAGAAGLHKRIVDFIALLTLLPATNPVVYVLPLTDTVVVFLKKV